MAKNPMQRKAQNSFLLGILVTLLITGIIIGLLVIKLTQVTKEKQQELSNSKTIYVLTQDVNSGEEINSGMLREETANINVIPTNALTQLGQILDNTVISKINLKRGTVITSDMLYIEEQITSDVRKMEYNVISLTSQLESGKYVDVRLRMTNGKDFIVLSHKKIEIPSVDGVDSENSIWMNLNETEILTMSCAIVETYKMEGAFLYAAEYIEPGLQQAATETYIPNGETMNLIKIDPNCVLKAKEAILKRSQESNYQTVVRNSITNSLTTNDITDKVTEEVQKMQQERQKYLESLGY